MLFHIRRAGGGKKKSIKFFSNSVACRAGDVFSQHGLKRKALLLAVQASVLWDPQGEIWIGSESKDYKYLVTGQSRERLPGFSLTSSSQIANLDIGISLAERCDVRKSNSDVSSAVPCFFFFFFSRCKAHVRAGGVAVLNKTPGRKEAGANYCYTMSHHGDEWQGGKRQLKLNTPRAFVFFFFFWSTALKAQRVKV